MKAFRGLAIVLVAYVGIVVAFELLVVTMGKRQADSGVGIDESWLVITTSGADGAEDTVLAGVESEGRLYVSTNHWPRGWYDRAVENPDIEVTRAGQRLAYRAVPVAGAEHARISQDYGLPWWIRLLTGFPPRSFLRLDAASRS